MDSRPKPAAGGFGAGRRGSFRENDRAGGRGGSSRGRRARGGIGRGGAVDAAAAMPLASGAGGRGEWDCPACAFRNAAASARCDVCDGARAGGAGRGGGGGAGAEPSGDREGASGGGGGGKTRSGRGVKVSLTAVGGGGVGNLDAFIPGRNAPAWGS